MVNGGTLHSFRLRVQNWRSNFGQNGIIWLCSITCKQEYERNILVLNKVKRGNIGVHVEAVSVIPEHTHHHVGRQKG